MDGIEKYFLSFTLESFEYIYPYVLLQYNEEDGSSQLNIARYDRTLLIFSAVSGIVIIDPSFIFIKLPPWETVP